MHRLCYLTSYWFISNCCFGNIQWMRFYGLCSVLSDNTTGSIKITSCGHRYSSWFSPFWQSKYACPYPCHGNSSLRCLLAVWIIRVLHWTFACALRFEYKKIHHVHCVFMKRPFRFLAFVTAEIYAVPFVFLHIMFISSFSLPLLFLYLKYGWSTWGPISLCRVGKPFSTGRMRTSFGGVKSSECLSENTTHRMIN